MKIFAWIRKIQDALHKCAESIRNTERRKKEQQLLSDKPVEVRAVVSYDENTVADAKAQATSEHTTQESIKKATWAAFVAVAIYALITLFMWGQMIKQSRIASETLRQSAESFRTDERAWVEIEPIKPTFIAPADDKQSAAFTCDLYPKNAGRTVARNIVVKAWDFGASEGLGDNADAVQNTQDKLLLREKDNPVVAMGNPIPKTLAPNSSSPVPFRLTCQAPQVFPSGHQFMHYMIGRIDYCDEFQVRHWLKFCFYVVNAKGEVWACHEGNDEDRNTEEATTQTKCEKPN